MVLPLSVPNPLHLHPDMTDMAGAILGVDFLLRGIRSVQTDGL